MHYVYGVGKYHYAYVGSRLNIVGRVYRERNAAALHPEFIMHAHEQHALYRAVKMRACAALGHHVYILGPYDNVNRLVP